MSNTGIEPATLRSLARCYNQLSYAAAIKILKSNPLRSIKKYPGIRSDFNKIIRSGFVPNPFHAQLCFTAAMI